MFRFKCRVAGSWVLLILCAAAFLLALLYPLNALGLTAEEATLQSAWADGQVIRLHILAEDDSPRAQALKLAVRDCVLAAFGQELRQAGTLDADAVYKLLNNRREQMQAVAQQTAAAWGFVGPVKAEVGVMQLPDKQYGDVLLPAGEYRALRITLGKGKGQNWWCVLFPQLCLSLASDEPWQTLPQALPLPKFQWHSLDILSCWTLLPPQAVEANVPDVNQ